MQVLTIDSHTHSLRLQQMEEPTPQAGQVLIRVTYAGVNRTDLLQVEGRYPAPTNGILGLEVAGIIEACGEGVEFAAGDAVCALLEEGGYGEYVVADARLCLPVPPALPLHHAAALPEALMTSWMALHTLATLQQGETALIHGGASGVGSIAMQLAKWMGARVITTASTEAKAAYCKTLGAEVIVATPEAVTAWAEAQKADVILDMIGGEMIAANVKVLRYGGRLVSIACMESADVSFSMAGLLMKNLKWMGMTLRSQSIDTKARLCAEIRNHCWSAVEAGHITPRIDSMYALQDAQKAHAHMRERGHIGKLLLQLMP